MDEVEGRRICGTYSLEEFVNSLKTPRKIIIWSRRNPVDDMTVN